MVARSLAARPRHWIALGAIAAAAVIADQLTKHVVASELFLDEDVKVVGPFSIHHVQNSGIAFGLFASATGFVILLTLVAVAWMLVYFYRSGARHPLLPIAVGLLIGGSLLVFAAAGYVFAFAGLPFGGMPDLDPVLQLLVVVVGLVAAGLFLRLRDHLPAVAVVPTPAVVGAPEAAAPASAGAEAAPGQSPGGWPG